MNFKWEKTFGKAMLSCVAVIGLSSTLSATSDNIEKKPNFAFSYPKDLRINNPRDFYFYVEGLAFQGMQQGLEYVIVDSNNPTQANPAMNGTFKDVGGSGWDYNGGLRAGWGIYMDHDAWNFDIDWLWVNVTNSSSYDAGSGSVHSVYLPDTGVTLPDGSAGANWQATVNVLDATLGKPYYISKKVIFNPHFGLRFAWIDQELGANVGSNTPAYKSKINTENNFFGVGGRVGVNTDWELCSGFKLFSNVSSSILAGWFDITENANDVPTKYTGKVKENLQMVVPNLELGLGFDWGTYIDNCNYYLDFRAGYEFQVWWDQWNARQFVTGVLSNNHTNVSNRGNFILNGFTFKIQLDM